MSTFNFTLDNYYIIVQSPLSQFSILNFSPKSREKYSLLQVYIFSHSQLVKPTNCETHTTMSRKKYTPITGYTSSESKGFELGPSMLVFTCWSWQAPTPQKSDLRALIKILPSKNTFFFFFFFFLRVFYSPRNLWLWLIFQILVGYNLFVFGLVEILVGLKFEVLPTWGLTEI